MLDDNPNHSPSAPDCRDDAPEIADIILDRKIMVAWGRSRDDKNFLNKAGTVEELLEKLTEFERGPKDGRCLIQGRLAEGGQRVAKNVAGCDLLMVDVDTGESLSSIAAKIEKRGLFAVLWTTHSHLKNVTEVREDAFLRYCKSTKQEPQFEDAQLAVQLVEYLTTEKRMISSLFGQDVSIERKMLAGGVTYLVTHAPCPRVRALFVLAETFSFSKGGTQKDRIDLWKKHYADFCVGLDIAYDKSCVDPSRLMYCPRIAKDADINQHAIRIIPGKMLEITAPVVDEMSTIAARFSATTPNINTKPQAGLVTPGLMRFVASYPDFDIVSCITELAPEDVRGRANTPEKTEFMCPYEDGHTSADPEQVPFFVASNGDHWHAGCQTDGCKGASNGDRVYFLDALCQKYSVSVADLEEYSETARREKREGKVAAVTAANPDKLADAVSVINKDSKLDDIRVVLLAVHNTKDKLAIELCLGKLFKQTGIPVKKLRDEMKEVAAKHAPQVEAVDDSSQSMPDPPPDLSQADVIWLDWGADKVWDAVEARMSHLNNQDPFLFTRPEGGIVRLQRSPANGLRLEVMDKDAWASEIGQHISFRRVNKITGEVSVQYCDPQTVSNIAKDNSNVWPVLNRVTGVPVFGPDGSLRTTKGYDPELQIWFEPKMDFYPLPDVIEQEDVESAVGWLTEAIQDFAFSDVFVGVDPEDPKTGEIKPSGYAVSNMKRGVSSRANFISAILTPFVREMIDGPVPLMLIDKPTAGEGAGYLGNVLFGIVEGTPLQAQTMSENNEEFKKTITATLRDGAAMIFIDNVRSKIDSSDWASALTSETWTGRILGQSANVNIKMKAMWLVAGIKVDMSTEMMRRTVPIYLNSGEVAPAERLGVMNFEHADLNGWVKDNRKELVLSCHILIQNWINKGKPKGDKVIQSFNDWTEKMSGILTAAGIPGFLENLSTFKTSADEEQTTAAVVAQMLYDVYGEKEFTARDAHTSLTQGFSAMPDGVPTHQNELTAMQLFGRWFKKKVGNTPFKIKISKETIKKFKCTYTRKNDGVWYAFIPMK
jgi:hypothetical protein